MRIWNGGDGAVFTRSVSGGAISKKPNGERRKEKVLVRIWKHLSGKSWPKTGTASVSRFHLLSLNVSAHHKGNDMFTNLAHLVLVSACWRATDYPLKLFKMLKTFLFALIQVFYALRAQGGWDGESGTQTN